MVCRLFYSDHLSQTLSQVVETLSDFRQFRILNQGLIFANSVHHSFNRKPLWILFWAHNIARFAKYFSLQIFPTTHTTESHDLSMVCPSVFQLLCYWNSKTLVRLSLVLFITKIILKLLFKLFSNNFFQNR